MSLISIPVYNTPENNRGGLVRHCLISLSHTVNWDNHRLFLIDDCSTDPDIEDLYEWAHTILPFDLIRNSERVGTAKAVNKGWANRKPGENAIKADSDILFHTIDWADQLEEVVARDPRAGCVGCKRPDLQESPDAPKGSWSHSDLLMLPHKPGEWWLTVEVCRHILGSAQLYNSLLLDKMGYLIQFKQGYGLDDSIACTRSEVAGFYNCFLPHIRISHPDPGGTSYQKWKESVAGECLPKFDRLRMAYKSGALPIFHGPNDDLDEILKGWK